MVTLSEEKQAPVDQETDLSWLFTAERLAVAVNPWGPGFIVKGTDTLYLVTTDPPGCECPRWKHKKQECAHIKAARRPPTRMRAGFCPVCGDDAVTEMTFDDTKGFLMRIRCWSSFGDEPACDWVRVM